MREDSLEVAPIVSYPTRTQSESVETVINGFNRGDIIIPDYQRDAEQWEGSERISLHRIVVE